MGGVSIPGPRILAVSAVAGGVVGFGIVRLGLLPPLVLETALIGAVFALVAVRRPVVNLVQRAGRPIKLLLFVAVIASSLGQLFLGDGGFPFVRWDMYSTPQEGDPTFYEWDVELRSGRRIPLVPGRFLAPESADRLVEALRRQVVLLREAGAARELSPVWREHRATLWAVAGAQLDHLAGDPMVGIIVSERTISLDDAGRRRSVELWRVPAE